MEVHVGCLIMIYSTAEWDKRENRRSRVSVRTLLIAVEDHGE